jgi:regulator of protease activity HflC (stomatin/prohibitin superfamily)
MEVAVFGIQYLKAGPTSYVIQYRNGRAVREGPGLSFYYFAPRAVIVRVPISSVDVPFVFNEVTADFQDVTLQGQLTYRVTDPKRLAQLMDYTVQPNGRYVSDDPRKLDERLVAVTQVLASAITHRMRLREVLGATEAVVAEVLKGLQMSPSLAMLGVEVLGFSILSIKPSPETGKALEAEAREALLRQSDEAVYARRNAAVAQERLIRESELNTEIAVEEKKRQIRETQMAAEIAVEERRAALLEQRVKNDREEADAKAYGLSAMLAPVRDVDWRTLTALSAGKMDPRLSIAMAFRDLAQNAEKIGELNITPELLAGLIERDGKKG